MELASGSRRILCAAVLLTALCGCAAAPVPVKAPEPAAPQFAATGFVIGTISYASRDGAAPDTPALAVNFRRLQVRGGPQNYTLTVTPDRTSPRAFFAGVLPSGVYEFRDAGGRTQQFEAANLHMPFEVRDGTVSDLGNFSLRERAALVEASLAVH